jgi:hypothetical protein
MARVRVEGNESAIVKWAQVEIGHVIEGEYLGTREGKFGLLADLETPEGPVTVPMPSVLARQLAKVRVGAVVTIQYDGLQMSQKPGGKEYHAFTVFVEKKADLLPAPPRPTGGTAKAAW